MISEFNKFAGNKILGWLLMNPDSRIHINELARELGASPATILKYSNLFEETGIVTMEKAGTARLVILNNENPIVKELKKCTILLLLNEHKIDQIAKDAISVALYGSASSGTFSEESDVDILVIGDADQVDKDKVLEIQEKIRKTIQLTIIPWHTFEKMKKENEPFIKNVIENHVLLSGVEL